jgi:isopentenyl diphosphate isomerase/L-lactate dehydrogenase-like FMN-dependent dehydrogenase
VWGRRRLLLGRATLYGLAAGGQPGVAKSLSILREEVDRVFALLGCSEASELTGNHVTVVTRVQ